MSDEPVAIHLREISAKCTLCDWKVAHIDTNPGRAQEIVDAACDAHLREFHPDELQREEGE